MPFVPPGGSSRDLGKQHVYDIFGNVLVATRDPHLAPANAVDAVVPGASRCSDVGKG